MALQRHIKSSSCLYSIYRCYVTKESVSYKEEKNMLFKRLGDDLLEEKVRNIRHKLLFNSYISFGLDIPISYIEKQKIIKKKISASRNYDQIVKDKSVPISLKFLGNSEVHQDSDPVNIPTIENPPAAVHCPVFPYQINTSSGKIDIAEDSIESKTSKDDGDFIDRVDYLDSKHWMQDYEIYDESAEEDYDIDPTYFEYGTPDSSIPASVVPCGGCGAHLHCQDPSIPGYLPREIFSPCSTIDLKSIICQRCHLMKHYNMALNVNVKPEDYSKLLEPLRYKKALVVLMVDITDFPCSIWPGILDVIGPKRPIFVVGNKIDIIPGDKKGWLKRAENSLRESLPPSANVLDLMFISAKTGYGVEDLITKIFNIWQLRGDVYLVGCTNVGKSSLFNALLQSDLCKVKASDLVRRSTTSPWPGTTLNLLKFPIMKPTPHEMEVRNVRLMQRVKIEKQEKFLYEEQKRAYKWKDTGVKSLVGHIGRTFGKEKPDAHTDEDEFSMDSVDPHRLISRKALDDQHEWFAHGKWCYDTPGTVQPDQLIHLLTTEELVLTLPKSIICPRVFHLRPGQTLFIAGMGRLDFVESTDNLTVRFAVMASNKLPITACYLKDAEEVYNSLLGTKAFLVPMGSSERLRAWPPLEGKETSLVASGEVNTITADLVLSSAGWVAVNMVPGQVAKFQCWTPEGRGIYVRHTPLQKYIHLLRREKPRHSVMYKMIDLDSQDEEL